MSRQQITDGAAAKSGWTSLEVTKLFLSALTPLVVLLVGAHLSAQSADLAAKRAEQDKANARFASIVDRRAAVWDRMGPLLGKLQRANETIGDGVLVGNVDTGEPPEARNALDELADLARTYDPYFSPGFNKAMGTFISQTQAFYAALRSWRQDRAHHRSYGLSSEDMLGFKDRIDGDAGAIRRQLSVELGVDKGMPAPVARRP